MKNKDFNKGLLTGAVSVIGILVVFFAGLKLFNSTMFGFSKGVLDVNEASVILKMNAIETIIDANSYYDADGNKVESMIYKGLVAGLGDKYAAYYTPEEFKKVKQSNEGKYVGIGVKFDGKAKDCTRVLYVYENTPAEKAGIQPGDIIKSIDGIDFSNATYSTVSSSIKLTEKGSVTIGLYRPDTGEEYTVDVEVAQIEETTIFAKMLEDNIGYIQIRGFQTATLESFKEHFETLKQQGMKSLILDVRDNPGGYVNTVLDILDYMLPECDLLKTEKRGGKTRVYSSDKSAALDIPCVLLVNEESASASEILTGAMKDNGAATVVGVKTYGKGIVQATYPLLDGSAVKLTVEKYFTPLGNDIHEQGIEPDVEIINGENGDAQLEKAIELLTAEY